MLSLREVVKTASLNLFLYLSLVGEGCGGPDSDGLKAFASLRVNVSPDWLASLGRCRDFPVLVRLNAAPDTLPCLRFAARFACARPLPLRGPLPHALRRGTPLGGCGKLRSPSGADAPAAERGTAFALLSPNQGSPALR